MKHSKSGIIVLAVTIALVFHAKPTLAQAPVITSFGHSGELKCSNLQPGSTGSVEWASSVVGPWTNSWASLNEVKADSNGVIRVSVPMFYRVRGVAATPVGMELIPAGSFTMGNCMELGEGNSDELPLHTVQVSAFYMDKFLVTKALWDEVATWAITNGYDLSISTANPDKGTNHPVDAVNWYGAVKWCNARSEREGRVPAYYTSAEQTTVYRTGQLLQNNFVKWNQGYRLPTEAEWEKAARGGASGQRFPWGNTISWAQANYYASPSTYTYDANPKEGWNPLFGMGTCPVGSFAANGFGLYDMAGNEAQWCWDVYGGYPSGSDTDPRGSGDGTGMRVFRGGNWGAYATGCRSALRYSLWPHLTSGGIGFRTVIPSHAKL